ncbi:MAG TPA: tetratricopeptide repeat protein [Pseudobdellovibrionaceae bacterium]|nr:tetratricopeptide repeat protein [Pseudobdellovibrionaceae bacterium]
MMILNEAPRMAPDRQTSPSGLKPTTKAFGSPNPLRVETATLLTNANVLLQAGETHLALNLLRQACSRDSKNPSILRPLAETLEACGCSEEAMKVREALSRYDYGFESVFNQAQALYRLNKDAEALNVYYEALSILSDEHPALFEIHKNMGNIFVRSGDYEGAEESYNKAYRINPDSDTLMVNLGTLEIQRGDKGRALSCFRQAVELNPSNDRAWAGLAMIHQEFGDHDLAWGNLERALDLNPSNRTAVHLAANWASRDQAPWRAIPWLQNYLSSVESDEEMSLVLVNLFCSSGQLELAQLESSRVLAWNPGRRDVAVLQERLRQARGE